MPFFVIAETAFYRVEAHCANDAMERFIESDNINDYFTHVEERTAVLEDGAEPAPGAEKCDEKYEECIQPDWLEAQEAEDD